MSHDLRQVCPSYLVPVDGDAVPQAPLSPMSCVWRAEVRRNLTTISRGALDPLGLMLYELAPGVVGYTAEHDGITYVPMIEAMREGNGDVGRYLDSLPVGTRIPNVISDRLEGMLRRRKWLLTYEFNIDERIDVWVKT